MQDRLFSVDDEGVAGIIAALKSDYDIRVLGEEVDDLALALISPLSSDDSYVGHVSHSCSCSRLVLVYEKRTLLGSFCDHDHEPRSRLFPKA